MCLVFIGTYFVQFPYISECGKLDNYDFPVYTTKVCPRNKKEWTERSSAINCTEQNGYMCMPNDDLTELLEFCYIHPFILIEKGFCLYLYKGFSRVNVHNCEEFLSGCPKSVITSLKMFEYQNCLSIGNGCFLAEPSCESVDNPQETIKSDNITGFGIFAVFAGLNTFFFLFFAYFHHKQRKGAFVAHDTEQLSLTEMKAKEEKGINTDLSEIYPIVVESDNENKAMIEHYPEGGSVSILKRKKCGISPLIVACESGRVQYLSTTYSNINFSNEELFGPLYVACQHGHSELAHYILNTNAYGHFSTCIQEGRCLLFVACKNGHTTIVRLLLGKGVDVNFCNENGASPLYVACFNGHTRTVQLLLQNSADINLCSKSGASPLYVACQNEHKLVVQTLLNNDAQINICDEYGASPLYIACQNGHDNIVKLLLDFGADINFGNKRGLSPLNVASLMGHESTARLLQKNWTETCIMLT